MEIEDLKRMCLMADEVSFTKDAGDGTAYSEHYRIDWATDEQVRLVDPCDDDCWSIYSYERLYIAGDNFEFYQKKLEKIGELRHDAEEVGIEAEFDIEEDEEE